MNVKIQNRSMYLIFRRRSSYYFFLFKIINFQSSSTQRGSNTWEVQTKRSTWYFQYSSSKLMTKDTTHIIRSCYHLYLGYLRTCNSSVYVSWTSTLKSESVYILIPVALLFESDTLDSDAATTIRTTSFFILLFFSYHFTVTTRTCTRDFVDNWR